MSALDTCFKLGYCHRDLKPDNLLFDRQFNLKMADFGFSTCLVNKNNPDQHKLYTMLGTKGYMAPEIHERKPYVGSEVDLFACGVILFIMRTTAPPFRNAEMKDGHYAMLQKKPKKFWKLAKRYVDKRDPLSDEFIDLVNSLLSYDAKKRYTME